VTASDQIWHALGEFRSYVKEEHDRDLPIVSSFGGVAASGGYYVAAGSDRIFCEPTTITGSIGVLAQVPTFADTLDKLGIDMVVMEADGSPRKELANNPFRDWTDEDREVVSNLLNTAYERFVEVVDQGRKDLDEQAAREAASGAVYTANEAIERKLVDQIGYLNDAVAQAASLANLPADQTPHVTVLSPRSGLGLLGLLGATRQGMDASSILESIDADRLWSLLDEATAGRLAYRVAWR
jgi:protease-4